MNTSLILDNLLTPPILFFFLGMVATWWRSDLEIPPAIARFLSQYLLVAIGFQGGYKLYESGMNSTVAAVLIVAVLASALVPVWSYYVLRLKVDAANAAAIAATYGSISAVTFITAVGLIESMPEITYGGYMVAAMAVMESPAIIVGVLLYRMLGISGAGNGGTEKLQWGDLLREALLNGAVLLLLGSMAIGIVTGSEGWDAVKPLLYDPFKGILCLFLLDMGLVAAKRLRDMKTGGPLLIGFAILSAPVHAMLGIGAAYALGLGIGDALLLAVLVGSASYIAVPAAMRLAIPQANPSLYVPMSLGITFPFNIAIGIPLYLAIIKALWS
jgi:hypothetical protein